MKKVHLVALTVLILLLVGSGVIYFISQEPIDIEDTIEGKYNNELLLYENIVEGDSVADSIYLYLKEIQTKRPITDLNDTSFFGIDEEKVLPERIVDMLLSFETFSRWSVISQFMDITKEQHMAIDKKVNSFYIGSRVNISNQVDGILIMSKDKFCTGKKGYLLVFKDGNLKSIAVIFDKSYNPEGDGYKTKLNIDSQHIFHYKYIYYCFDVVRENYEDSFDVRKVDFHYDESGYVIVHNHAQ